VTAPVLVAIIVLLAYLLGSIPTGLLVSKSQGMDIRQHGSGNIGATNVWRVMGKKWGLVVFFGDLFKGLAALVLAQWIATHWPIQVPAPRGRTTTDFFPADYAGIAAALGCIIGHNFPIWLRFKGGKGVATSLGVIIGMMPIAALVDLVLWATVFKVSGYVSLASIAAAAALPVIVVAFLFAGWLHGWGHFFFAVAAGMLVIRRHRDNITRLIAGTESRFGKPRQPAGPAPKPPEESSTP
jgi:glycerol-3-phosphate acyltransferase PlsY